MKIFSGEYLHIRINDHTIARFKWAILGHFGDCSNEFVTQYHTIFGFELILRQK